MGSLGESSTYVRMMNSLEALGLDAMASALPGYEAMVSGGEMDFCCLCQAGNEQNGTRNLNSLADEPI